LHVIRQRATGAEPAQNRGVLSGVSRLSKTSAAGLAFALAVLRVAASEPLAQEVPKDTVIILQHGACERRCAVYKVAMFADGVVLYDGEYYVRRVGTVRANVSRELIGRLLQHAAQASFFEMPASFSPGDPRCGRVTVDGPIVIVTIVAGGKANTVTHDHRCLSSDSTPLARIESEINIIAGVPQRAH
jgi:hypothetical protein